MGVTSITQEFSSPVAPERLFKALILDSNNLIPNSYLNPSKVLIYYKEMEEPEALSKSTSPNVSNLNAHLKTLNLDINSINLLILSIFSLQHEASHFKYVKHQINELDKQNLVCKYTMIEGDALGDKLESIVYEIKFEASGINGAGCVCKMTSEYHTLGGYEVKEEEIKGGKESAMRIYKVVEAHLLENPHLYA
ncbi:UNVERIFIED_CONTAM: Pathogenesis-related protein STH-2 [Sesamum calycinum]|uniref:Pathogenesis-related protein STH-2 n=1 Tax=Sesamum calycinum TaxID=2727403 RepID=A0AAW2R8W5_9LAMI